MRKSSAPHPLTATEAATSVCGAKVGDDLGVAPVGVLDVRLEDAVGVGVEVHELPSDGATTTVPSEPSAGPEAIGICSSPATLTSTRVGVPVGGPVDAEERPGGREAHRLQRTGRAGAGGVDDAPMPAIHVP